MTGETNTSVFAEVVDLSKRFYATQALDTVSVSFKSGEVHALIGENGAGKSTLIKILGGVHQPDTGKVMVNGKDCRFAGPREALEAGIVVIPQEMQVVPAQTVAENVLLGDIPTKRLWSILPSLDRRAMAERCKVLLNRFNLSVDPNTQLDELGFAERQLVMIARALNHNARLLILDEPTAALETREVTRLFDVINRLKADGVAIVFISHRLDEIEQIADKCTVLRDGKVVDRLTDGSTVPAKDEMIRMMTGRDLEQGHQTDDRSAGDRLIQIDHGEEVHIHSGEIVGLAGLLGGGMTEFLSRIFGADKSRPQVDLKGYSVEISSPSAAIRNGIGLVPGERRLGLIMGLTVRENIVLPNIDKFKSTFGLNKRKIDSFVKELIEAVDIRPRDPDKEVRELSGGNQQKVIFARWLAGHADLLLLDEPTHGIDVGAKAHIHRLMNEFTANGGGIMFASSEMTEILSISDRVLAMRAGEIVAHIRREGDYTEKALRDALGG